MSRPTTPHPLPAASATLYPLPSGPPSIPKPTTTESFSSPPRSSTHHHHKPSKPHIPHHPHRTHHRHHHTADPSKAVPQSAITGPSHSSSSPFGDFLTKTKSSLADPFPASASTLVGLGGTQTPPRSGDSTSTAAAASAAAAGGLPDPANNEHDTTTTTTHTTSKDPFPSSSDSPSSHHQAQQQAQQKHSQLTRLRRDRHATTSTLQSTLTTLSHLSTTTTRRLDYTYYSLLTSLSSLRSGLSSLHSLAQETRALREGFDARAGSVRGEVDVIGLGTGMGGWEGQEGRVVALEGRLRRGREKVEGLRRRLEGVRGVVEGAGERERRGRRARRRGWWRVGWGCICVGALVVGGLVGVGWWKGEDGVEGFVGGKGDGGRSFWEMDMREGTLGAEDLQRGLEGLRGGGDVGNESSGSQMDVDVDDKEAGKKEQKGKVDSEATLRLFDEL